MPSPVFKKKEYQVINCEITNGAPLLRKILHNYSTVDSIVCMCTNTVWA